MTHLDNLANTLSLRCGHRANQFMVYLWCTLVVAPCYLANLRALLDICRMSMSVSQDSGATCRSGIPVLQWVHDTP